jgi:hypothetical protein
VEKVMKIAAIAVAGFVTLAAGPAFAQSLLYAPPSQRPMMPVGPMPAEDVFEMVRAMGLEPIGRPVRNGPYLIQRASDFYGKPMRVTIDAARAQVVSVEAAGGPPAIYGGPYAATGPYAPAPWRGPYRPYTPPPEVGEVDYAPPGSIMTPPGVPARPGLPNATGAAPHAQPHPSAKSAAITPARPPVPRKRPAAAPQEAAGTVEPLPVQKDAAPAKPADAPANATPPAQSLE